MDEELLFRFLLGQARPAEREAVTAWRNASQEHEARLADLTQLLELAGEADVQVPTGDPPGAAEIIQLASRRAGIVRRRRWLQRFGVGLAAAAVALVAVGLLSTHRSNSAGYVFGAGEFVTGSKETATVRLGEGSVVRLAPASRLRVIRSPNERVVSLEGRAYFAVTRVEGRRFEVRTRAGTVIVLGTRFDLEANADTLALIVVEGRVALSTRGQQATLESGERSGVKNGRLQSPTKVDDVARSVAWTGNFLVFQATPLAKVASEIAHHYGVRVEIPDPALATRTVTAWLSEQSLDEALNVVCTIVDAQCLVRNNTVIMRPQ
jgi:ferric-dicitrate binding protein FerR (iron transport regulator)